MSLPQDEKPVKIIYEFKNGDQYFIDGPDVEAFNSNMSSASFMGFTHGMSFSPINWKKIKKLARKTKGGETD